MDAPATPHSILIVDDNESVARILQIFLEREGHIVARAADGQDGLHFLENHLPDLIFLDLDMPRMDGFEMCYRVKSDPKTRFIPIVILTGRGELQARLKAWELGADDFLTKPFQGLEVAARCRSLLRIKDLIDDLDSAGAVVFSLARAMEAKNYYTQGHTERVTGYSLALARRIGLPEAQQVVLQRGAALHDIGKIAIPDLILNKPASLTPEEYDVVKQHPVAGVHIVEPLRSVRDAVPLIRWHHERMDGQGYPDGLPGEEIPLLARILAVTDVFDALASARPYRGPLPLLDCLEILRSNASGGGLDPALVDLFCAAPAIPLLDKTQGKKNAFTSYSTQTS